jgi:2-polyprenyl-3-methyl-5-hydroxy-6-metoxy-1,4-benzoquinol methylase
VSPLARAEENRRGAGLANAAFHDARREPLPADGRFALVTTFDCLHDMTDPAAAVRGIRAAIRPDGVWLVCEIKAATPTRRTSRRTRWRR